MSILRQRQLGRQAYGELRKQVLERDSWRCQNCGSSENLQVHHIQSRGRLGADTLENLTALCASCHRDVHLKFYRTT